MRGWHSQFPCIFRVEIGLQRESNETQAQVAGTYCETSHEQVSYKQNCEADHDASIRTVYKEESAHEESHYHQNDCSGQRVLSLCLEARCQCQQHKQSGDRDCDQQVER